MHYGTPKPMQHIGMATVKETRVEYHCRSLSIIEDGHMTIML